MSFIRNNSRNGSKSKGRELMTQRQSENNLVSGKVMISMLLSIFLLSTCYAPTPNKSADSTKKDLQNLLELIKERRISKVKVCYSSWQAKTWGSNRREEDFLKQQHDITVDVDPVYLAVNLEGKLRSLIRVFRYERVQSSDVDFRLGCIFYKGDDEVVRFVFSSHAPVVSINGTLFAATPDLLITFAELLPHAAYEEVNHAAFKNWMIDCATLYNRTDINTIINKLPEDTNTN